MCLINGTNHSGSEDNLCCVREPGPESEQQDGGAGRDLAALDHARQRKRDRCRGCVAGCHDVACDEHVRGTEATCEGGVLGNGFYGRGVINALRAVGGH